MENKYIVPLVISAEDQVLIMGVIMDITNNIREGTFQPTFMTSGSTYSSFGAIADVKELFQMYVDYYLTLSPTLGLYLKCSLEFPRNKSGSVDN
jgi:hypothetical protein